MIEVMTSSNFETSDSYVCVYYVGRLIRIRTEIFVCLGPIVNRPYRYGIHISCENQSIHITKDFDHSHATLAEAKSELEKLLPIVLERTKKAVASLLAPVVTL